MTTTECADGVGTGPGPAPVPGCVPAPLAVSVIGGGASGVLAAAHLLRASREAGRSVSVELFEPAAEVGRGVAYGTDDRDHLLNVPAGGMSAWPDRPTDFAEWAARRAVPLADGFAPRADFARYLASVLANARAAAAPGSLTVHRTAAVDLLGDGVLDPRVVIGADGTRRRADLVVVATGWSGADRGELPQHPRAVRALDPGALTTLPERGGVVVLGAGLTGIDTALSLLRDAPQREVVLVSRSGEMPRAHLRGATPPWTLGAGVDQLPAEGPLALPAVRAAIGAELAAAGAAGIPWQSVVEALKPVVATLWVRLPHAARRTFLHEDLRRWDVHRHRMAPVVANRVAAARRSGRLRTVAGAAVVTLTGRRLEVHLDGGQLHPVAVVDCRGWGAAGVHDAAGFGTALLRRGLAAADPLGLSLDTTVDGRLRDARGRVAGDLVAIGPARRAATWESTALGAIREQAAALARTHLRATSTSVRVDRSWRNVRIHTLHDPVAYRRREVGDHVFNGTYPQPTL